MGGDTPQRLGDYEVLKVLGAGGMGRVYQVRNVITERVEAMKVLLPETSGQEQVAARFLREIKVLAALDHPNIATLHTALTIDNQLVMVMEYVEGRTISSLLAAGPIPLSSALTYIDQVLDALGYAHQRHVIHRDIKPANMMLTPSGAVKLMDFGIAHAEGRPTMLTVPGSTLGSVNYMSPEQVNGEPTDERSDLYSLGISLYEMTTGERPFHGDSSFSVMAAHVNKPPTPPVELLPEMPPGLNQAILTSIAKSPAERFQTADAFRSAVRAVLRGLQGSETAVQGSQDATSVGSRTPSQHVRTGPTTRPGPTATPTPVPATPRAVTIAPVAAAAAAPAPAAAPVPAPVAAPAASHRGLYMGLGALIVVVVLVAAGLSLPNLPTWKKGSAADEPQAATPAQAGTTQPAAQPPAPPPPAQPTAVQPAKPKPAEAAPPAEEPKPAAAPAKRLAGKPAASQAPAVTQAAAAAAAAEAKAKAEAEAKELDEVEHEIDQLTGRAAAVNNSLDNLQRQQAAAGFGLRIDMAAKQATMKNNLAKAQDALNRNDLERARRYAALAASDIEALEKFLGR